MKYLIIFFTVISFNCIAHPLEQLVSNIRNNGLSINEIHDLYILEKSGQQIGYGLCVAAGRSPKTECKTNGSIGYGLCVVAGKSPKTQCRVNGSIGYGMCVLSGHSPKTKCASN